MKSPPLLRRSIVLALASLEAQPLFSHTFYFVVESIHFRIVLFVLRFGPVTLAQFLKRFFDREFGGVSH
jgi:hypothetical protein